MAFPVHDVTLPSVLHDQSNGQLDANLLATIPGQGGGPPVTLLKDTSLRSWQALCAGAYAAGGWLLVMTSRYDSYRPLAVQQAVHDVRYDDQPTGNQRQMCDGVPYWLKTNPATGHPYATAACPGHSNHGYAIAGDLGQWLDGRTVELQPDCLAWLQAHAVEYGWSWEFTQVPQPEPWHLRHFSGDTLTPAVLAYEQGEDMAALTDDQWKLLYARIEAMHLQQMTGERQTTGIKLSTGDSTTLGKPAGPNDQHNADGESYDWLIRMLDKAAKERAEILKAIEEIPEGDADAIAEKVVELLGPELALDTATAVVEQVKKLRYGVVA